MTVCPRETCMPPNTLSHNSGEVLYPRRSASTTEFDFSQGDVGLDLSPGNTRGA